MKKKLKEFSNIKILKRNEKLQSSCCYLLSSESVASCTYFETKRDVKRAHNMFNKHLSPIMNIVDFLFTPNGWLLMVTVNSEDEILDYISSSGYTSTKMKNALKHKNISLIISECIRYAISGIARITNRYNRRLGALVSRNFSRYIFSTIDAAIDLMKKMKIEQVKLCNKRIRYRPNLSWFDINGELRQSGDVYLCGKNHGKEELSQKTIEKCIKLTCVSLNVLRKYIYSTLSYHSINRSNFSMHPIPLFSK